MFVGVTEDMCVRDERVVIIGIVALGMVCFGLVGSLLVGRMGKVGMVAVVSLFMGGEQ